MQVYNPYDVFVAQMNSDSSSFVERVLVSIPNSVVFFDSTSSVKTLSTSSLTANSITSSFSITSSYSVNTSTASFLSINTYQITSSWSNNVSKLTNLVTPIKRISGSYNLTINDSTIICFNTSSITLNLPTASYSGIIFNIKSNTSSSIIVSGSEPIDNQSNVIINNSLSNIEIQSDGYQWWIL